MILSSRSIKFSRLDRVDDLEECVVCQNVRLGQYVFVSCWTEEREESIPLWKMYSGNNHGVRIALDSNMFEGIVTKEEMMPNGLYATNCSFAGLPKDKISNQDYYVLPVLSTKNKLFYCKVEYVEDINEKTKGAYQLNIGEGNKAKCHIAFGEIGKYKNLRWKFQQESRFRIVVIPVNISTCDAAEAGTLVLNAIHQSVPLSITDCFLEFREDALDDLEVLLHPNSTESDRIIVEALCSRYAQKAKIGESCLKGRVFIK